MTIQVRPPGTPLIPETAPFSEEQRSWLNGFFAGVLSLEDGVRSASPEDAAAAGLTGIAEEDDGAPWHDPSMDIDDRMQLAEGRPLRRRMMAAMAQQDCGQCGYNCEDYADAIADQSEGRLNLCVPGGKATNRMLKSLAEEIGSSGGANAKDTDAVPVAQKPAEPGRSREAPVTATLLSRYRLNGAESAKTTNHIEIDLSTCGLDYVVGDSLGVFAQNDGHLVDQVLAALGAPADLQVGDKSIRDALISDYSLYPAPDSLFELISYVTGGDRRKKAQKLAQGEDLDGDLDSLDVLGVLEKFPGVRPDPEAFVEALEPLQPRLYSISSSIKANPGRVSLTVDRVQDDIDGRSRLGLASTYLGDRAPVGADLQVYVQKAHGFALPDDGAVPIIMVGPGTGIAPFRAFLQERKVAAAVGKAWLFYGHQRSSTEFFYKEELQAFQREGTLTNLSLAWSRDGAEKVYVQNKMREEGRELFAWLEEGAHFYICGDAKRMAKDVELALCEIIATHGNVSQEDAKSYVDKLKQAGRYQADVY